MKVEGGGPGPASQAASQLCSAKVGRQAASQLRAARVGRSRGGPGPASQAASQPRAATVGRSLGPASQAASPPRAAIVGRSRGWVGQGLRHRLRHSFAPLKLPGLGGPGQSSPASSVGHRRVRHRAARPTSDARPSPTTSAGRRRVQHTSSATSAGRRRVRHRAGRSTANARFCSTTLSSTGAGGSPETPLHLSIPREMLGNRSFENYIFPDYFQSSQGKCSSQTTCSRASRAGCCGAGGSSETPLLPDYSCRTQAPGPPPRPSHSSAAKL